MEPQAAYLHVPLCRRRCGYCNFTVVAGRDDLAEPLLEALARELSWLGRPRPVKTLFFGGGTPTHLPPPQLARLLDLARQWFPPAGDDAEVTIEANPTDLTPERLDVLCRAGVGRISLGIQSFDDAKLAALERDHRREEALEAVRIARDHFASVAVDLIFAAPGETLDGWRADLRAVIEAEVDHVSTYGLTYERGARFFGRLRRGALRPVAEEVERAMYEEAIDRLTAAGFEHYEVSNFARPGRRCRHNETYWRCAPYFAAGPGAAGYVAGRRTVNHRSTFTYLKRVQAGASPVAESEVLDPQAAARERLVFGLRMMEGVDRREFAAASGWEVDALVGSALAEMVTLGLLADDGRRLRLTRAGLLVSDAIWPKFLESTM